MRKQLTELRAKMRELGIDVYVVSDKDEHLNEYTGAHFCALREFSGFTGGDGTLVAASDDAALWTDGRYFTQAEQELAGSGIRLMKMGEPGTPAVTDWIRQHLPENGTLGFDGRCTSYQEGMMFLRCKKGDSKAVTDQDVCGLVWKDRPAEVCTPCWILEERYSGKPASVKLREIRGTMLRMGIRTHVVSSLDDIAWILNLRASDIPNNPVFMAYMLFTPEHTLLYSDPAHFDGEVRAYLAELGVELKAYDAVFQDICAVESPVLIDRRRCSYALSNSIPAGSRIFDRLNPAMTSKCCKNETERANIRIAQHRDSLAVTRFFYWFDQRLQEDAAAAGLTDAAGEVQSAGAAKSAGAEDAAARGPLTEWECVEKLHEFRAAGENFLEESFPTISAYGPNAAMAHYMPSPEKPVEVQKRGLYLVDSGGHYKEGTTDTTRTWSCGEITEEERTAVTLAVIANLRLADAKFPEGTSGLVLDYAAREPFWKRGMNYNHGTGHGVGQVLNVHEAPVGIRYRASTMEGAYPMQEGMYVSDEPGYYEGGKFGVRIENMLLAVPDYENEYGKFLKFETCTFIPLDRKCIDKSLMTAEDICLLNAYQAKVFAELSDELGEAERKWLEGICAPI